MRNSWRQKPTSRNGTWRFVASLLGLAMVLSACGGGGDSASEELDGPLLTTDPATLQPEIATAMGNVTSVRFQVDREAEPVFIDQAESIALNAIVGRFQDPGSADAIIEVTVNDALNTQLGAIAIDDEVWLTDPVTGQFDTLPPGFDIDPSLFFDPVNGWRPLIADLTEFSFVAEEERDGNTRYHLSGTAPAERMQSITAGLVRGQEVDLDLWVHPVTAEVAAIEFATEFNGARSEWTITLTEYGETFDIEPPEIDE